MKTTAFELQTFKPKRHKKNFIEIDSQKLIQVIRYSQEVNEAIKKGLNL